MAAVLFEHERRLLSDELRARYPTLACRACKQLIGLRSSAIVVAFFLESAMKVI
jgi:hypothetical protein